MKLSISETDDLVFKDIQVPEEAYLLYCDKFHNELDAINLLEFRIDGMLRKQRRLLYKSNTRKKKTITVGINPYLLPLLETYCAVNGLSLGEYLTKIMKWTRKRKQ
jgi:hypothetical protein